MGRMVRSHLPLAPGLGKQESEVRSQNEEHLPARFSFLPSAVCLRFRFSRPTKGNCNRPLAHGGVVMHSLSIGRLIHRHGKSASRPEGFSLLEMMMVVTVILIVASISAPIYMTAVVRAREAVLPDDLLQAVSSQPSAFSECAESR